MDNAQRPKEQTHKLASKLAVDCKANIPTSNKFSALQDDNHKTPTKKKSPPEKIESRKKLPPSNFPPGHPNYNSPVKTPNKRISILLGDSNVRFVGEKIHNYISSDFIVCGVSGCGIKDVEKDAIKIMKDEKLVNFDIQFFIHVGVNDVDPYWDNSVSVRSLFRQLVVRIHQQAKSMQSTAKIYLLSIPPTKKHELITGIKNCDAEERIVQINSFLESRCEYQIEASYVDVVRYQQGKFLGKDYLHYRPKGALKVALVIDNLANNFLEIGTHRLLQDT